MENVKVIYNPKSGKQLMEERINLLKKDLEENLGVKVETFATSNDRRIYFCFH